MTCLKGVQPAHFDNDSKEECISQYQFVKKCTTYFVKTSCHIRFIRKISDFYFQLALTYWKALKDTLLTGLSLINSALNHNARLQANLLKMLWGKLYLTFSQLSQYHWLCACLGGLLGSRPFPFSSLLPPLVLTLPFPKIRLFRFGVICNKLRRQSLKYFLSM